MKSKIVLSLFLCMFFLISACQGDKNEETSGDYSGVSELIAGRNRARYEVAENDKSGKQSRTRKSVSKSQVAKKDSSSKSKDLTSIILYEQKVKIVGTESNRVLAKGVAYLNKKGQIVRITILKE